MSEFSRIRETSHRGAPTAGLLSVIVVTYNSKEIVGSCIEPLQNKPSIEIIVVDNASSDGTADFVREQFPAVKVVDSGGNLGFAKGVNLGASYATGDALVLLNPDASVSYTNLLSLYKVLAENPDVGVVAPLLDHPGRGLSVREGGMSPTIWHVFCHYYGLSRMFAGREAFRGMYILRSQSFDSIDVDWVSGACMAVPSEVWNSHGGLSERWFMYAEDVELCLRIRDGGKRVVISGEIEGTHGLGESSGNASPDPTNALWLTNLFDLYKMQISPSRLHNFLWKMIFSGGLAARSLAIAAKMLSERQSPRRSSDFRRFNFYIRELSKQDSLRGKT
ncbi:MAG: glycosyltransferase family 2 protein [Rhodococcus sp. (in: high G+C Gram-positive bacteria)]|uniref:glycosyltransferase family 2 protein n=1 Tax=Rhodococcus sp. TaxID=1831 RepID=UPI002ADC0AED|nr:glycosyltransferase family 2 protein [Rhodococcus sp. (in: high G+C Gram-positive bacteria)]MDZ7930496.1 glycosyltransferase family 2 protein [Rhodococcus sp. (in: high G+C Gram-positive bacteria)]